MRISRLVRLHCKEKNWTPSYIYIRPLLGQCNHALHKTQTPYCITWECKADGRRDSGMICKECLPKFFRPLGYAFLKVQLDHLDRAEMPEKQPSKGGPV